MVNQNQGKEYNPIPLYNRKFIRQMLRNKCLTDGTGNVGQRVHNAFEKIKEIRGGY